MLHVSCAIAIVASDDII